MLRPRVDLDALAAAYDDAIGRLAATGAHVVMFTIFDPGAGGIYGPMRGRMAIFNEWVREIADRHGATLVDLWRMRDIEIAGVMDTDRMHLNTLRPPAHGASPCSTPSASSTTSSRSTVRPAPASSGAARPAAANAEWTREFLVPWVHRRLTGRSSGDTVSPKRPDLLRACARRSGSIPRPPSPDGTADVAQLVERDLPKVDVASSNLVIRSSRPPSRAERDTLPTVDVASSSLVIRSTCHPVAPSATLCPPSMSRVRVSSSAPRLLPGRAAARAVAHATGSRSGSRTVPRPPRRVGVTHRRSTPGTRGRAHSPLTSPGWGRSETCDFWGQRGQ